MAPRSSWFLLLAANALIPAAILIYGIGFFPYKPFLSGLAKYERLDFDAPPAAPFDKIIFMVVDALRSDFVFSNSSAFEFTQRIISNGSAIPFTARANAPTITMPRIKAITTGSTPSFLDLILNFAESDTSSTLAAQDTWLAQMKATKTGKLVMFGDDTWLKLFPDTFTRADGTSSFFVSDFTEVDNNVTRHVPDELQNGDWHTMVLHYLGLDHIGHKAGPNSPNMLPKQKEMDDIVRQVYKAITSNPHLDSTLLVLCGDHGMNDAGNHGGSAPGETSPALVFISPKLEQLNSGLQAPAPYMDDFKYYQSVEQSDIVPTLAALLDFPVPKNNLGVIIPSFLNLWNEEDDRLQLVLRNARQILAVVKATFPSFEAPGPATDCTNLSARVEQLSCQWRGITLRSSGNSSQDISKIPGDLLQWSKDAQDLMSQTASNYSILHLTIGQFVVASALVLALIALWRMHHKPWLAYSSFFLMALLYGTMTFASSYVEEEQHFWYWSSTMWLVLVWIKGYRKRWLRPQNLTITYVIILLILRVTRRWNQTGQKFAGSPDIVRDFLSQHTTVLWILVGISYLWNLNTLVTVTFSRFGQLLAGTLGSALTTAALTFKLAFTNEASPELLSNIARAMAGIESGISLLIRARIVFIGIVVALGITIVDGLIPVPHSKRSPPSINMGIAFADLQHTTVRSMHALLNLLLITQSRATNIPLLFLFSLQSYFLSGLDLNVIDITMTSLLLQQSSFFAFGNSNGISSIDLSSGYNGISGYNAFAVGVLTFISNWSGPIFWSSATTLLLLQLDRAGTKDVLYQHLMLCTIFTAFSATFVMLTCTILRTHLFIWTVFSPKYLYVMVWSLCQHLCVNLGLGSLIFWTGKRFQGIQDTVNNIGQDRAGKAHQEQS